MLYCCLHRALQAGVWKKSRHAEQRCPRGYKEPFLTPEQGTVLKDRIWSVAPATYTSKLRLYCESGLSKEHLCPAVCWGLILSLSCAPSTALPWARQWLSCSNSQWGPIPNPGQWLAGTGVQKTYALASRREQPCDVIHDPEPPTLWWSQVEAPAGPGPLPSSYPCAILHCFLLPLLLGALHPNNNHTHTQSPP